MNIGRDVVDKAVGVLTQAGYEKVWANYIVLGVSSRPENVEALANGSKGLLEVQSLRNLREMYSDKPAVVGARVARGFIQSVNLQFHYAPEQVDDLLEAAEKRAAIYDSSDAQEFVEATLLAKTSQEKLVESEKSLGGRVASLEGALKAREEELAAAYAKIRGQDQQLDEHAEKLDDVLETLQRETEERRVTVRGRSFRTRAGVQSLREYQSLPFATFF